MVWLLLLLVAAFGVLAGAAAEVALVRFRERWTPRRRVFTAAAAAPSIIAAPLLVSLAAMLLYPSSAVGDLPFAKIVTFGLSAGLAAFIGGIIVAFAIERTLHP